MTDKSFWRRAGACAVAVGAVMVGLASQSVQASEPTPVVPFEKIFAAERGDSHVLRFNRFSGDIPGKRIKALLQTGQIVGDRVLLSEDTSVYFPDGYIVQSQAHLAKYIPAHGLGRDQVFSPDDLAPNPRYRLVAKFDQVLGRECARVEYHGGFAALRRNGNGVMSLVLESPGLFDSVMNEKTITYNITSAVRPVFIGNKGLVPDLIRLCQGGGKATVVKTVADASTPAEAQ